LDPLSLIIATDHGVILFYSREYDRAIEQFRVVKEMEIDFPRSGLIYKAYIAKGDFATALAEIEGYSHRQHRENAPETFAAKAYLYGRWGRQADAQRAFTKFEDSWKLQRGAELYPAWMKMDAYMGVGRKGDVIAVLEREYKEHTSALATLKVDPFYDPLRDDPRFQDLLRGAHLSE
jgi:serine/threonine-protein kinase